MRLFGLLVATMITVFASADDARAAGDPARIALVIGNSAYTISPPLANPANDARLMAKTLRGLGFEVIERIDADLITIQTAAFELQDRLVSAGKDSIGLFYYAGHGVQVAGENYLIPLGADIKQEREVAIKAVSASFILQQMEFAENRMNFVILDACRNNPLTRSFRSATRGLARMDAPRGSLVAYSTGPGSVAADGTGRNSPYTTALAEAMTTPGLAAEQMFKLVRDSVMAATNGAQTPWEESSLTGGDFFFTPEETQTAALTAEIPVQPLQPTYIMPATPTVSAEQSLWSAIKDSNRASDYEAYLTDYPNGIYASLATSRAIALANESGQQPVVTEARKLPTPTGDREELELAFWEAVEDSDDPADFEDFITQFPDSAFAGLAARRLKRLDAPLTVAAVTPPTTSAPAGGDGDDSFDAGWDAYVREDYSTAYRIWRPLAEQGDAVSQYNIGVLFDNGQGTPLDDEEAVHWYSLAADQGDSSAQYNLALMYDYGEGTELDDEAAVDWYRRAADQGHLDAQYNLAMMYDFGEGVPEDDEEAIRWYRSAADQGHAGAQYNLGTLYDFGEAIPEDNVEAVRWYRMSANQGDPSAQYNLAMMYDEGEGVELDDAEAVKWYRSAADQEHVNAQYNLALMYDFGEGVEMDDTQAVYWYRRAADQGHLDGIYNLALMYDNGEGVSLDTAEAALWYRRAAEEGHASAQNNLALLYDYGEGVELDDVEAVYWFRQAADQGLPDAQNNLGLMYDYGEGVEINDAEAVRWYRLAAAQDHADAQNNLGLMYDYGEGVIENDVEAVKWYRLAANQDSANAQNNLALQYRTGDGVAKDLVLSFMWSSISLALGKEDAQENLDDVSDLMTASQISNAKIRAEEWLTEHGW